MSLVIIRDGQVTYLQGCGEAIITQSERPADVHFLFVPDLMTLATVFLALAIGWAGIHL